jgi:hypothetical protein
MAAKTKWWKGAWWLVAHAKGQRSMRRIGPTNADKRKAADAATQVYAALALGLEGPASRRHSASPSRSAQPSSPSRLRSVRPSASGTAGAGPRESGADAPCLRARAPGGRGRPRLRGLRRREHAHPEAPEAAHPRDDAASEPEEVSDETARRTLGFLERETGIEPATLGLGMARRR